MKKEKYGGYSGSEVHLMSPEERKKYNLEDAQMLVELVKYNDHETIKLMHAISKIVGLTFIQTCHGSPTNWWKNYLQKEGYSKELRPGIKKEPYAGGKVLTAEVGIYRGSSIDDLPIIEYDVISMYPTQMINRNLSLETVCCDCCENNLSAKLSDKTMNTINEGLADKEPPLPPREETYHMCKKVDNGLMPQILVKLRDERLKYKKDGNKAMSDGIKVLMNSLYGIFGAELKKFEYANYKLAELVTAYARDTLMELKNLAEARNFKVLYGDTDSLYMISKDLSEVGLESKFLEEWNKLHPDIALEGKNHRILLLVDEKNYIKITKERVAITKGLNGKKGDRPKLFNKIQKEIAFNLGENDKDKLVKYLKNECQKLAFEDLNVRELSITTTLGREPEDYGNNIAGKIIGIVQNKHKGETITYYKGDKGKPVTTPDQISRKAYIEFFKSTFKKQLKFLDIDFDKDVAGELIYDQFLAKKVRPKKVKVPENKQKIKLPKSKSIRLDDIIE